MSNPLAMQLLQQSLNGGCCGSALLGGVLPGESKRKPKPMVYMSSTSKPISSTMANKLEYAYDTKNDPESYVPGTKMKAAQYYALHNPQSREKAKATRVANKNKAAEVYNARILSGNPMSRLEYCMTKCTIANEHRKAVSKVASQRTKAKKLVSSAHYLPSAVMSNVASYA
jgi:hypothetical protein